MAKTWRERVDRVKDAYRSAFNPDPNAHIAPNGDWILDDRLVNMNLFSKEAEQAWRELERERLGRGRLGPDPA